MVIKWSFFQEIKPEIFYFSSDSEKNNISRVLSSEKNTFHHLIRNLIFSTSLFFFSKIKNNFISFFCRLQKYYLNCSKQNFYTFTRKWNWQFFNIINILGNLNELGEWLIKLAPIKTISEYKPWYKVFMPWFSYFMPRLS